MEITTCLWIFVLLLLAIIAVISLLYCAAVFHRHRAHRTHDIDLYKENDALPPEIKNIYISLVERRYSTIQNYFIYQIVNKVFGLTGVIYSVIGFGIGLLDIPSDANATSMKFLCAAISLVSIVSVIIALYLSPTKRVAEYINAWRIYDKKVSEMSGKLPMYIQESEPTTTVNKPFGLIFRNSSKKCPLKTSDIISEVSQFVFEVESSISSECE